MKKMIFIGLSVFLIQNFAAREIFAQTYKPITPQTCPQLVPDMGLEDANDTILTVVSLCPGAGLPLWINKCTGWLLVADFVGPSTVPAPQPQPQPGPSAKADDETQWIEESCVTVEVQLVQEEERCRCALNFENLIENPLF